MLSLTIKVDLCPIDKNGEAVEIKIDDIMPYLTKVLERRIREIDLIFWIRPLARIGDIGTSERWPHSSIDNIVIGDINTQ